MLINLSLILTETPLHYTKKKYKSSQLTTDVTALPGTPSPHTSWLIRRTTITTTARQRELGKEYSQIFHSDIVMTVRSPNQRYTGRKVTPG
jgi:hypothetical protein